MADYVSGTDFLHSFEEGFGDKKVFSGGAGARSERGQEYLFPRRYRQPAEKVVMQFPRISESDGSAAAERERGWSGAKSTSSRGVTVSQLRRF